ncbi:S-adenosylmethionine-diacylglycerol 3-amino-3-carboxypropyl transferase [Deinobacterium chartae]|uniref:S-adenosylmethionine-diacylglycerol 3-amino-3-carboxypropyl transferase n=1 Tax=Deinobacterium chartae TaxID=521158 RepID=A0A841I6Q8_9DEIO|nr:S-adenosylmethionine-diacylglycerol 3-amino-3-carboxypropyl transferase [Deinobacterium chartae]
MIATRPRSEVASRADFSCVRYAQVWEDADVLLAGLDVQPGDRCLSIASAGDNALALLTRRPERVVAVDLSAAQLHCLELRVAALSVLTHPELLELVGARPSRRRTELYARCRALLSPDARRFWDARPRAVEGGIGGAGKFEAYFALFRRAVLPLLLSRRQVAALLEPRSPAARRAFFEREVNTWRFRLLFRAFFSRALMGRLGRDPAFFRYVRGTVSGRIRQRAEYALTALDPADNPYLSWILTGHYGRALPLWLRPEHFETLRAHLGCLEWQRASLEDYLEAAGPRSFERFNLSDVFEYMSEATTEALLARLADAGRPGARLLYWNMLAPRSRPASLADRLWPLEALARALHARDRAFFYSRLVIEEVV